MEKALSRITGIALLLMLTGCGGISHHQSSLDKKKQAAMKMRTAVDDLFAAAVDAGQAVVIIPTVNLDSQHFDFHDNKDNNRFAELYGGVTEWVNAADPAKILKVGNSQKILQVGPTGSYYQTVSGRRLYQIYVVAPGHYDLLGASYGIPHGHKPLKSAKVTKSQGIGVATLTEATFREEKSWVAWEDPEYRTRTVTDEHCVAVRVVSGQCAATEQNQYQVTDQVSTGGYKTHRRNLQVPGLAVQIRFDKPFASFDIKPREVIVMDGFYPEVPAAAYKDADCKRSDVDKMQCQMHAASLVRIFASLKNFRSASDPSKYGFTQMSARLQKLQYREPQIRGREVARESLWGQPYQIGK